MAELDAMITKKLRKSNPALLQVWKQTRHVERPRKKATASTPAPTAALSSASKEAPNLVANRDAAGSALNGHEVAAAEIVEPRVNGVTA